MGFDYTVPIIISTYGIGTTITFNDQIEIGRKVNIYSAGGGGSDAVVIGRKCGQKVEISPDSLGLYRGIADTLKDFSIRMCQRLSSGEYVASRRIVDDVHLCVYMKHDSIWSTSWDVRIGGTPEETSAVMLFLAKTIEEFDPASEAKSVRLALDAVFASAVKIVEMEEAR